MARKGPSARGESACTAWAASSLPAPVSPRTRMLASVRATRSMSRKTCFIAGSSVHIPWKSSGPEPATPSSSSSTSHPSSSSGTVRTLSSRSPSGVGRTTAARAGRCAAKASAMGRSLACPQRTLGARAPRGTGPSSASAPGVWPTMRRSASSTRAAPASSASACRKRFTVSGRVLGDSTGRSSSTSSRSASVLRHMFRNAFHTDRTGTPTGACLLRNASVGRSGKHNPKQFL